MFDWPAITITFNGLGVLAMQMHPDIRPITTAILIHFKHCLVFFMVSFSLCLA
jgi:hypothetical protein